MLINSRQAIYLYREAVDMRKSIDGLCMVIAEELEASPSDGTIYVFYNKGRDKLKLIYWQSNGFCLWYKRLEKQRFVIPAIMGDRLAVDWSQLQWLLDGLDIGKIPLRKSVGYSHYY